VTNATSASSLEPTHALMLNITYLVFLDLLGIKIVLFTLEEFISKLPEV
jgi:hypothetical protein